MHNHAKLLIVFSLIVETFTSYSCPNGHFDYSSDRYCKCFHGGIWKTCNDEIIGVRENYCMGNTEKATLLIHRNENKAVILDGEVVLHGAKSWTIKTNDGNKHCVNAKDMDYCIVNTNKVKQVNIGCNGDKNLDKSLYTCYPLINKACEEKHHLVKRQGTTGGAAAADLFTAAPEEDEDNVISKTEIGDPLIRGQMAKYIENAVAKLVGLSDEKSNSDKIGKRYPILKLLELSKTVMQKTCLPINADFFNLATSSFINLQLENFHLKEPYIAYSAFLRIENALKRCIQDAKPHMFKGENATYLNETKEYCDNNLPTTASNITIKDGAEVNLTVPEYASGYVEMPDKINEPLIETVWKILVNAHSYCYTKFSDYYNDHHTFTVSLMPLFTNGIQEIWMKEGGYDLSGSNVLYGGLLGDPRRIINDVNRCVAASREDGMAYPWFMNRPPRDKTNEWGAKRRKRSICVENVQC